MKKIAMVVQRFGKEIVGGSESLAMQYAQRLVKYYDIDVITTTCLEYTTWDNHYPEGSSTYDGINIIRFKTTVPRGERPVFDSYFGKQIELINSKEPTEHKFDKIVIDLQGPVCPGLLDYISEHRNDYDAFLFITYQYFHYVYGLPLVAHKSVVVPTAHDDPMIKQSIFRNLFCIPRFICYLTDEERAFVQGLFNNHFIDNDIIGTGIEVPSTVNPDEFKRSYNIQGRYIAYLGRLDEAKGVGELISHFLAYKSLYPSEIQLVLVGSGPMIIPKSKDIISVGFVDEQTKYDSISGAELIVSSSRFESLCIALLEGMALGVPALVNGDCEVLKGHMQKSNAGFFYSNQGEFIDALNKMLNSNDDNSVLRKNAINYVSENYTWDQVTKRLCAAIEYTIGVSSL